MASLRETLDGLGLQFLSDDILQRAGVDSIDTLREVSAQGNKTLERHLHLNLVTLSKFRAHFPQGKFKRFPFHVLTSFSVISVAFALFSTRVPLQRCILGLFLLLFRRCGCFCVLNSCFPLGFRELVHLGLVPSFRQVILVLLRCTHVFVFCCLMVLCLAFLVYLGFLKCSSFHWGFYRLGFSSFALARNHLGNPVVTLVPHCLPNHFVLCRLFLVGFSWFLEMVFVSSCSCQSSRYSFQMVSISCTLFPSILVAFHWCFVRLLS